MTVNETITLDTAEKLLAFAFPELVKPPIALPEPTPDEKAAAQAFMERVKERHG